MKLKKLNSERLVSVNVQKYKIDWNSKFASSLEKTAANFFQPYWKNHIVCVQLRIPGSLLRCDFVNFTKNLVVEISPSQHRSFHKFSHKGSRLNYLNQLRRDSSKELWAVANNLKFIDIYEEDLPKMSAKWFAEEFGVFL